MKKKITNDIEKIEYVKSKVASQLLFREKFISLY